MAEEKVGFFKRLVNGLSKTRASIVSGIDSIFRGFSSIDDDFYEEIEEILVMGDIGINTTTAIISNLKMEVADRHITVSYTHLDVYKRQDRMSSGQRCFCQRSGGW